MPNSRIERLSAFTLTELLVVMAVIVVLAALLVPGLAETQGNSDRAYCKNNLRQIGLGVQLYAKDNAEVFPDCYMWGKNWDNFGGGFNRTASDLPGVPASPKLYVQDYLVPYLGTNANMPTNVNNSANYHPQKGVWVCPSILHAPPVSNSSPDISFSGISFVFNNNGVSYAWNHIYWEMPPPATSGGELSVSDPKLGGWASEISNRNANHVLKPSLAILAYDCPFYDPQNMEHGHGENIAHADGSADYVKANPNEVWNSGEGSPKEWWRFHSQDGWDY